MHPCCMCKYETSNNAVQTRWRRHRHTRAEVFACMCNVYIYIYVYSGASLVVVVMCPRVGASRRDRRLTNTQNWINAWLISHFIRIEQNMGQFVHVLYICNMGQNKWIFIWWSSRYIIFAYLQRTCACSHQNIYQLRTLHQI